MCSFLKLFIVVLPIFQSMTSCKDQVVKVKNYSHSSSSGFLNSDTLILPKGEMIDLPQWGVSPEDTLGSISIHIGIQDSVFFESKLIRSICLVIGRKIYLSQTTII